MKHILTLLLILATLHANANDSTRIPTGRYYKAYGHEFPIFYDGKTKKKSRELFYERTDKKRFYIKNKG